MPPTAPVVSVILTVFRRTAYLRRALDSALGQTLADIEVIVSDDSNSEDIRVICDEYQARDARVRYRASQDGPLGVALNVREAITLAQAPFISILNDDDEYLPTFLETLAAPLLADETRVLAFCNHYIVDEQSRRDEARSEAQTALFGRGSLAPGDVPARDLGHVALVVKAIPTAMSAVFRRDALALDRITPDVGGAYDFWLTYLLAQHNRPLYYMPEYLTLYRVHDQMETARAFLGKGDDTIFIYRAMLRENVFPGVRNELRAHLSRALVTAANNRIRLGERSAGREMLKEAWQAHPSVKAGVSRLLAALPGPLHRFVSSLPQTVRAHLQRGPNAS